MVRCIGCSKELPIFPKPQCSNCKTPTKDSFAAQQKNIDETVDVEGIEQGHLFFWLTVVVTVSNWALTILIDFMNGLPGIIPLIIGFAINLFILLPIYFGQSGAKYVIAIYYLLGIFIAGGLIFGNWDVPQNSSGPILFFSIIFNVVYLWLLFMVGHPSMTKYADAQRKKHDRRL